MSTLELIVECSGEREHVLFAAYQNFGGQPIGELFSEFLLDEAVQFWVVFEQRGEDDVQAGFLVEHKMLCQHLAG